MASTQSLSGIPVPYSEPNGPVQLLTNWLDGDRACLLEEGLLPGTPCMQSHVQEYLCNSLLNDLCTYDILLFGPLTFPVLLVQVISPSRVLAS